MSNVFSIHGKNIVDLIKETPPDSQQPPAPAAPASQWVQGSHNIVFNGTLSINIPRNSCPAKKDGCDE